MVAQKPSVITGPSPPDISGQIQAIRRRWRTVLGCIGLALLVAGAILALIRPTYTSTVQVLLDARRLNILQNQSVTQGIPFDATSVESEVSLIRSFSVARRVVDKLGNL